MLIPLDRGKGGKTAAALGEFLRENIVGQDRAIKDLVNAMESYEAGFKDAGEPIYCVLLSGPSGVGKTLTAEMLAKFLFGDNKALTKVACSDYTERHDISALIGAPPGYIGFFEPGDPEGGGAEPILSQWSIDKHAFLFRNKQSGDKAVADASKQMEVLSRQEEILTWTLTEMMEKYNEPIARLRKQTDEINEKVQDAAVRQTAWQVVNALLYSCRKIGLKKLNSSQAQKELEKRLADLSRSAQKEVWISVNFIKNHNPVIAKILQQLLAVETAIAQLGGVLNDKKAAYKPGNAYLSVVLFDEIEKANQALHNLLLEIMDKGRVNLKNGQVTSFANSIVVLTSNIGEREVTKILSGGGFGFQPHRAMGGATGEISKDSDQEIYDSVMRETKKTFPAFFLGRLDNIVVYRPLNRRDLKKILEMQLQNLHTQLAHSRLPVLLKIEDAVKEFILDKSMKNAAEGVRVLNKRIRIYIIQELGRFKNSGQLLPGDTVHVQLKDVKGEMKVELSRELRPGETAGSGN